MSLYNAINGVNPATFLILPMLGKHPDEYPRFRDCFVEDDKIVVFTRVGGGNRNCGFGEEELQKSPYYLYDEDWSEDSTYGIYYFKVPDEWKEDFEKIVSKKLGEISEAYFEQMCKVFPKLADKFKKLLKGE